MTSVPTQYNVQPVNEMVSHETRDLMLVLILWGKGAALIKQKIYHGLRFLYQNMRHQRDKFQNMFMRVRQYKRIIA